MTSLRKPKAQHIQSSGQSKQRLGGFDGLRGIAAGLVLIYHFLPNAAPAGYLGVDIFFVLSGFLISSLLLEELASKGVINLKGFWARRFRRLVPAVVTTTIVTAALAVFVPTDARVALPRQVIGSLTGTYNWIEIAYGSSYFEHASPLLLTNMWSLAVEQQFYLIWPPILMLLILVGRRFAFFVALVLGAASAVLHFYLGAVDQSRAYMGTDTHLWGLMIGAALAFAIPGALRRTANPEKRKHFTGLVGLLALFGVVAIAVFPPEDYMRPLGLVLASLLAALTIRAILPDVSASGPGRFLLNMLDVKPLVWFGERSYGIYLWHWPLWVLCVHAMPLLHPIGVAAIVLPATLLAAAASYRFIETPIRTLGFVNWCRRLGSSFASASIWQKMAAPVLPVLVLGLSAWSLAISPVQSSAERAVAQGSSIFAALYEGLPGGGSSSTDSPFGTEDPQSSLKSTPATPEPPPPLKPGEIPVRTPIGPTVKATGDNTLLIGDSVALGSADALGDVLPGIYIDAEVSRSIKTAPAILAALDEAGAMRDYVVISLVTNTEVSEDDLETIIAQVGQTRAVVLVTGFGPARCTWIPPANETVRIVAERHPNVLVAPWDEAISPRMDLLAEDLVHPGGPEGQALYAQVVADTLASWQLPARQERLYTIPL